MSFLAELKRRNVLRVGAAYVVAAWQVIQVVETIFPAFGFGDVAVRNTTIVFAIGFIPALIFAWAFELTPEGLKKESEVDRSQSVTPHTGKKLDRMIMVGLAVALGYFAFDKFVLDPQREAAKDEQVAGQVERAKQQGRSEALVESYGDKSIAVLPFVNMSSDEEQEYFSDGISEELLNLLAKIPELRVISRSSAFSYKGKDIKLAQVAEALNVAHILEGSVRKAGKKIRITAQLIDARSDTHLWSETYDRTLDDVFAIQDDIAAMVVAQLKITLLGEAPHVEETDPEAYALHLQARHLGRMSTAEGYEQSIALYQQALAIDPEYPAAWDGLAGNYINMAGNGLLPWDEGYAKAREATEKALAIDPDYAPAHSRLGWIAMYGDNDLAQAARHFERALQLDPDAINIIGSAAVLLFTLGGLDEAIAIDEYVATRDPVNPNSHFNLAESYLSAGRWDEAIAAYETTLRLSPGRMGAHYAIGRTLLFKGEFEAALESFTREEGDEQYRVKGQALALYALGRQEEHQAKLNELIERWGDRWPSEVAHVYAFMGNADLAFEWLNKAVLAGETFDPAEFFFQPLADDPRWLPFLESIGRSPEQLAAIKFEVKLPAQ
ncbi:MAG TPA: tetratricopeptide repeat protein [Thioalkalivibrio sp.]|nr:tetratricopeptide repeat protein [Thioalkalivibrio sp.]